MKVIVKAPGQDPEEQDIGNDVESIQKVVGGYFEAYRLGSLWLMCNEDGKRLGLPVNLVSPHLGPIVGTVMVSKADDEGENIDLMPEDAEYAKSELIRLSA